MNVPRLLWILTVSALPALSQAQQVTVVPAAIGDKTQLTIQVSGLVPAPQERRLAADVEVVNAEGRTLASAPGCCRATVARNTGGVALLQPAVILEPDSIRRAGIYTVRVSVTDGTQSWTGTQALTFSAPDLPGTANEAPRLRMNAPAEGVTADDKRDCLGLSSPSDVIRCSEKKKR